MNSLEITIPDIAKFFYKQDIGIKRRVAILSDLWLTKIKFIDYTKHDNLKKFSNEIDGLLMDRSFYKLLNEEKEVIRKIQEELDLNYTDSNHYMLNNSLTDGFLKQCKLRVMFDSNKGYIYMKMRTLLKNCGYKRRSTKFLDELKEKLSELELYITDGNEILYNSKYDSSKLADKRMDEYVRIYSYCIK